MRFLVEREEGAAKTVSDVNPLVARVCRWAPYAKPTGYDSNGSLKDLIGPREMHA